MASSALRSRRAEEDDHGRLAAAGRRVIHAEMEALRRVADQLGDDFERAVELVLSCSGSVIVTGIGKAGIIAQKLSATLASTGTSSHFLHAAEAVHGDLGRVCQDDLVVVLSYSGETAEVTRILESLVGATSGLIAITSHESSTLARAADLTLVLGKHREACGLGLAPSASTTAMLALGDALALVVSEQRQFTRDNFAKFHPAGNLGWQLSFASDVMRPLCECRVADHALTLREVLVRVSRPGRRTGAIMLIDAAGKLVGIFTDSDLARLLERSQENRLDQCVSDVMSKQITTVHESCRVPELMKLMSERKLSELPVVSSAGLPLGIIDITDLVSAPNSPQSTRSTNAAKAPSTLGPLPVGSQQESQGTHPRIIPLRKFQS